MTERVALAHIWIHHDSHPHTTLTYPPYPTIMIALISTCQAPSDGAERPQLFEFIG
jgi:hypothetical protein